MTRLERIKRAVEREEHKREANPPKVRQARRRYARRRIRWDRPLPHEVRP